MKGNYVYTHHRLSDDTIFYIGKGSGDRAYSAMGREKEWREIIEKEGGVKFRIVKDNLDTDSALLLEKTEIYNKTMEGIELINKINKPIRAITNYHPDIYIYNGKSYPSRKEIMNETGVSATAVLNWIQSGKVLHYPEKITIGDKVFTDRKEAAEYANYSTSYLGEQIKSFIKYNSEI